MPATRLSLMLLSGLLVWAQEELPERVFRAGTNVVLAPVTVKTKSGAYVDGLEKNDFRLYDNGKPQKIELDVESTPISLLVAIQRNNRAGDALRHIKMIGPMLEALVIGENGEAALLAFDHRLRVIQDWTNDGAKFKESLDGLIPGSTTSAVTDAVFEGVRMLKERPADHRRVLLLISETKDRGSEGHMRDALLEAEFANVVIYTININRALAALTTPSPPPRPDPFPVASRPLPGVAPQTPQMTAQLRGEQSFDFKPVVTEVFNQVKGLFIPNHAELFTRYTGGREYSFTNLKSLERAIADIGEELHSQYMLSYTPNNLEEAGYHEIHVDVTRPGLEVRTREGYWMAYKAPTGQ